MPDIFQGQEIPTLFEIARQPEGTPAETEARTLVQTHWRAWTREFEKNGYTQIKPCHEGLALATGIYKGRNVAFYFADAAQGILTLSPMSEAQYEDAQSRDEDIVFSAFAYQAFSYQVDALYAAEPVMMRLKGSWGTASAASRECLPVPLCCGGGNRFTPILGAAGIFKYPAFMSFFAKYEQPLQFHITGIGHEEEDEEYQAHGMPSSPMAMVLEKRPKNGERFRDVQKFLLYYDKDPVNELELVDFHDSKDDSDIVVLMDKTGRHLLADCAEAFTMRRSLKRNRRYLWTLTLAADGCLPNPAQADLDSGAFCEMEKARYRDENGHEPPEDYKVTIATNKTRMLHESDGKTYASVTGVVESAEPALPYGNDIPMTHLRLLCLPDNDDVHLNVYINNQLLGGYTPKQGDNVFCSGYLTASPDKLVEAESWQDSAEVGFLQTQREYKQLSHVTFIHYADFSIALASVAAALIRLGWRITDDSLDALNMGLALSAADQAGHTDWFFVDSVLNGCEPANCYDLETIEPWCHKRGGKFHIVRVALDYKPAMNRYAVRLLSDGGFAEKLKLPVYTAARISPAIPPSESGEAHEAAGRPDEEAAARLFAQAVNSGEWREFARRLPEDLEFFGDAQFRIRQDRPPIMENFPENAVLLSTNYNVCFSSKVDFLLYMAKRRAAWRNKGLWKEMRMEPGTVSGGWAELGWDGEETRMEPGTVSGPGTQGETRPCTALRYQGKITTLTVFDTDADGAVRTIRTLPSPLFPLFVPARDAGSAPQ